MKTKYANDKEVEETFGHKKRFKGTWIKGGVIKRKHLKSTIVLNERLLKMSIFERLECLWHETLHCLTPHWIFDEFIDFWNRIKEHYLEGRTDHPIKFFSARVEREGLNKTKAIKK